MSVQIKEFCFNANPWRITWLGGLRYPGSAQSEPRIQVLLSELVSNYTDPLPNKALAKPSAQRMVWVKIGQIALLRIGSVWVDGVESPTSSSEEKSFVLHHDQLDLVRVDGNIEIDGNTVPVLSSKQYRIGPEMFAAAAGSWLAVAYDPTPDLRVLAIPPRHFFKSAWQHPPRR